VIAVHDLIDAATVAARFGEPSILLSGIKLTFAQSGLCNAHELRKMLGIANKQNEQRLAIIDSPLQT
jgi:hypothetical protein